MPRTEQRPVSDLELAVAARLRAEIALKNAKKSALAQEVGVHRTHLSRVIHGHTHIDVDLLAELCDALGLDIVDVWRQAEAARDNDRRTQSAAELRDRLDESGRPNSRSTPDERPNAS